MIMKRVLENKFEEILIPKIYKYAKIKENEVIEQLRAEIDGYKEDIIKTFEDTEYMFCNNCYHLFDFNYEEQWECTKCMGPVPCLRWCVDKHGKPNHKNEQNQRFCSINCLEKYQNRKK